MKYKVLFVCSGNKENGISPIVYNQGETLKEINIDVEYFPIKGKGINGYLSHYFPLQKKIRSGRYKAIHAHYSYCGILSTLASPFSKTIVSLMGSFYKNSLKYYLVKFFSHFFWKTVIVKSTKMKEQIQIKNAVLIPNGVQIEKYRLMNDREKTRQELGFKEDKKYVIFVSNPARPEKNYSLAKEAVELLKDRTIELIPICGKTQTEVVKYQTAADVLMLTSFTEGSPNVIKEAMAAGCPIVTTNVGDVKYIIGQTTGCFILKTFGHEEAAECLKKALIFNARTEGLSRIISLGLDSSSVAEKISRLYIS